jgi:hypothetical protein
MKTIKLFICTLSVVMTFMTFAQAPLVTFVDEASVWKQVGDQFVSEFKVTASEENLNIIKQNYDSLGSMVSYSVKNSSGNVHTIEMKFSQDIPKIYLHKMLLFIGCQNVVLGGSTMTLDDFAATLN